MWVCVISCSVNLENAILKTHLIRVYLMKIYFILLVSILTLNGCSSSRPVLYHNEQYNQGGEGAALSDIDACKARAKQAGVSNSHYKAEEVATNTAQGAAIGATSGLIGGAISGGLGLGAAIGAASGAAAGLISSMFTVNETNPTYQNYINRCLHERGYEVMGWE